VVLKLLSDQQMKYLIDLHDRTHGDNAAFPQYYNTADHLPDTALKYLIRDEFRNIYSPLLEKVLIDYKVIYCNYNVKKPGENSMLYMHQDYSYCDEQQYTTLNAWTPLADLRLDNSFLGIVKGSYKFVFPYNGRNIRSICDPISNFIIANYTDKLLIDAGSVVIWDHTVLHHSPPNRSGKIRIAMSNILIPKEADVVQYALEPDEPKVIKGYKVTEDHLIEVRPNEPITGIECFQRIPFDPVYMTEEEFTKAYHKANDRNLLSKFMDLVRS
jgi:hypothetical protein